MRYEKLERSFVALNHLAAAIIAFRKDAAFPGANASLGGIAATRASGTMRENVMGLTVVTASGEVISSTRRPWPWPIAPGCVPVTSSH